MARVVFLGTPRAAVPTLQLLDREHTIGLVVTQPDRPKGRSGKPVPPPVKEYALEHGLPIAQPNSRGDLATVVSDHGPFEVGVVVAYGRILRPEILDAPEHGLVNVHFSLLPRWRGAAPVARALMARDTMTGVTIMRLDEGLDTGPVLTAQAVDIGENENAGELTERLAILGARLLASSLVPYMDSELQPVAQTDEGSTYAAKLDRQDRPIDIESEAASAVARVRGLAPEPAATLEIDGERHKIYEARVSIESVVSGTWRAIDGRPFAGLPHGAIELVSLQAPGKTKQTGEAWVNGRHSNGGVVG